MTEIPRAPGAAAPPFRSASPPRGVPLQLVYLCRRETWERKMSRVRFHSMRAIGRIADVVWTGPGWRGWDDGAPVQDNLDRLLGGRDPDLVIGYKPLDLPGFAATRAPRCVRYNEMYDVDWTLRELQGSNADLVVCHHRNDWLEWRERLRTQPLPRQPELVHIAHCAEASVFRPSGAPKTTDLLLVGATDVTTVLGRHYPLRDRMPAVFARLAGRYRCAVQAHPGYDLGDAHTDRYAREFAAAVDAARIGVTCSGAPRSRYGKYVEVPMCGTALAADLPDEAQDQLRRFVIELDPAWTDDRLASTLAWWLDHPAELQRRVEDGLAYAALYTQEQYAWRFVREVRRFLRMAVPA
ncbi:MAG: hypothetical protein AB7O97_05385 [Planctomycetota bacterium]